MKAFIFPGQGSQKIGMGQELALKERKARQVFEEVDDALGEKLSDIIWGDNQKELTLTRNAQPALMAMSLAVIKVLEARGLDMSSDIAFMAGHSLGEYSALIAGGAISLRDGAKLLRLRGQAMQDAVPFGQGAMAALLGLELDMVQQILSDVEGVVSIANDNMKGQIVISGDKDAVARAMELAKERDCRKAILLEVSAPFHCPLMALATMRMKDALADIAISPPKTRFVENIVAREVSDGEDIRRLLVEQIEGAVRWRESMDFMVAQKVDEAIEIGAGRVLTSMFKRQHPQVKTHNCGTIAEIDAFWQTIGKE